MGKSGKPKRFFPSVRGGNAGAANDEDGEKFSANSPGSGSKKRKKSSANGGSDVGGGSDACGSKEELEARLQALLLKVEEFRYKEKKAARARVFRSIGKVRKSLELLEHGGDRGAEGSAYNSGDISKEKERKAKKQKRDKTDYDKDISIPNIHQTHPNVHKSCRFI